MLTFDIKKKINTLRDILVGKVPDPKAQVEQITIALIYKFMDDMDTPDEFSDRKFFTGEYEKYAWTNIMSPQVSGAERVAQYGEGMEAMQRNPQLPQLFRDIFKNAYLPYRDSETLTLFLKEINSFSYDNSEDLGNAFEYLLSIMGSQGDAGQFRTPRHIIDMIVEIVQPKKGEKILDPACGTAGFLISAYKHVVNANKDENGNDTLTAQDRAKLTNNFIGYDISPDMVRLSRVNMYLHRFLDPKISETDTLTNKDVWQKQYYDCVLANPPFMTPKGGINPHNLFKVQANRSEVLFVDYIAENLTPNGRAGIIVPEGIIFQTANAYKNLRKMLVNENYLYAVISLPSGIFNPYSGVKTSILLFDRSVAKKTDKILFLKMNNDGFDLGAQRRDLKNDGGDIPKIISICEEYRMSVLEGKSFECENPLVTIADKSTIAENDFILVGDRYKAQKIYDNEYPMVRLGDVCEEIKNGKNVVQFDSVGKYKVTRIATIADGTVNLKATKYTNDNVNENYFMNKGDILFSHINSFEHLSKTAIFTNDEKVVHGINLLRLKPNHTLINSYYLINVLKSKEFIEKAKSYAQRAVNQASLKVSDIKTIEIPLPPLSVQEEIVKEIEGYQKIIDGAKLVVDNYKPIIFYNSEWDNFKLGDICNFNPQKSEVKQLAPSTQLSFVPMAIMNQNEMYFSPQEEKTLKDTYSGYTYFKDGDVLLAKVTPCFENGKAGIAKNLKNGIGFGSSELYVLRPKSCVLPEFIYYVIHSKNFIENGRDNMVGSGGLKRLTKDYVLNYSIALPSLEIQQDIVSKIEEEQKAVDSCKTLIKIFEQKIKQKISEVWGE